MDKEIDKEKVIKEIHHNHCDNCMEFILGSCGGIQYYIPTITKLPLCSKVKAAAKKRDIEV